jgi:DNA-binding CsgD family transcriptional regulator
MAMVVSSFNQQCLEMLHSQSVKEFSKQLFAFAESLGFGTVAAMVITDHSPSLTEFQTVTNAPAAYLGEFENLELGRIDPVSQHCKTSNAPIVWDRRTYVSPREQELWQRQAEFGLRSGIAVAMHPGRSRHFMLGADWSHDRCANVPHFKRIGEDLLEFAAHAQAAAFELGQPAPARSESNALLERSELEALGWSMDGKTSWEIGAIMSISERHATLMLRKAMRKLGCSTKYEAVLRAIRLGLLNAH